MLQLRPQLKELIKETYSDEVCSSANSVVWCQESDDLHRGRRWSLFHVGI